MTSQQLAAQLSHTIDSYEYPRVDGTVGTLWTSERVADEVARLRQALVAPTRCTLHVSERPDETVWLVAALDKVAVYLDDGRGEFGLGGLGADG